MTRARDVANLIGSGNYSSTTFTATAGQTAFTISHTQGFVQVFMNGLLLDETVDYTSNGSAVTLTSGAAAGDEIEVVKYNTFSVGDALNTSAADARYYTQSAADTRYVNTTGDTMTGALTVDTSTTTNLNVDSANYGGIQLKAAGTDTGYITSYTNGSGAEAMYIGGADTVNIHTGTNHALSNGTTRLQIDGSGRVTMPNQPSFYAYTSTDYTGDGALTGGGNWAERWDTGNNFSAGTFTAPVAGKYFFSVMWDANAIRSTIDLEVNGTGMIRYEPTGRTDDTWETHALTGMVSLAANDTVRLYGRKHSQSSNNPYHMGGGLWGHFAGFLIG